MKLDWTVIWNDPKTPNKNPLKLRHHNEQQALTHVRMLLRERHKISNVTAISAQGTALAGAKLEKWLELQSRARA
jgi:hypothetical protein